MKTEFFQTFIDGLSEAFTTGDYDLWRSRVRLPVTFVTPKGSITFETEDAFRADFESHLAQFRQQGLTGIRRTVRSVETLGDSQAIATYDTDILRGDELLYMPYTSSMMLSWEEADGWRCTTVMNALGAEAKPAPKGLKAIDRTPAKALEIYQKHLDVVNDMLMTPGMPGLEDHIAFPAEFGTLDLVTPVINITELRALLEQFVTNLHLIGTTDYIRIGKAARFSTATRIEGWHVTHVLRSGTHILQPYKCDNILELRDGQWRVRSGMSQTFTHVNGLTPPDPFPKEIPDFTHSPDGPAATRLRPSKGQSHD